MMDLGPVHYFLGMEILRTPNGLSLTQSKYIKDLLTRTKMQDAKHISSPVASGRRLSLHDGAPLDDPSEYRSVVGALQYLTLTRPDIAFAVNHVCQFMHQPTSAHWVAVKRILRYLNGTSTHGLFYKPGSLSLMAYSDADYAGDPDDRRSTGGYCLYLGSNLISWSSKKQGGVFAPAPKPSTANLLILLLRFLGSVHYFVICNFLFLVLNFGVTTLAPSPWPPILSSMPVLVMLKLIIIMFVKKLCDRSLTFVILLLMTKLSTFLRRGCLFHVSSC
ncbi:PREDICTED: poly [Prunus dulcis]|uniref:PREDICTED: poly n=1 Tax=Prunus dulcis TaxID=3755 RepID=A0A5E4GEE7_PRUDU|nr:PREDICTED: poly [Prunus dulcis]